MSNPESILDSVKKALGLDSTDTSFDLDVTLFINSTFGSLKQLGVGSDTGFIISDNTTLWSQYVSNLSYLGMIKSYIFMKVKLMFDPPEGRATLPAIEKQIEELGWRINVEAEHINPPTDPFGVTTTGFEYGVQKTFISPKVVQLAFASSITPNASDGNVFYLTMTGDCTINAPINGSDGQHITLEVSSGGHAVTWRSGWDFGDGGVPVLSSGGQADIISAYYKETSSSWRAGFATGF